MPESKYRNGFIHVALKSTVEGLRYLNLMEYCKYFGSLLSGEKTATDKRRTFVSNTVDLYTLFKWVLVSIFWINGLSDNWITILIWYLILTNLHTFVYYFLWKPEPKIDHERSKKRFVKLILAIFFSDFCFAYLFQTYYHHQFVWEPCFWEPEQAIWYSISNSVAGNYDKVKPATEQGYTLMMMQYMITFFYVGVLISKAIPQKSDT